MYTITTSPLQRYQSLMKTNKIQFDTMQQAGLNALDELYVQLSRMTEDESIRGIYLWGEVGRGKTFLMDLFVDSMPPEHCLRLHFHHFMKSVHQRLRELTGHEDPLHTVASQIRQKCKVLCFDEFFVSDIGDAMLLGRLMQYLFEQNVTLVATSNTAAENLYQDGLQRSRFLPAVDAILDNTLNINLSGGYDHRERDLAQANNYFVHDNDTAKADAFAAKLSDRFGLPVARAAASVLTVLGREIPYIGRTGSVIAFDFMTLCDGPRSHLDYIELARQFESVILLNLPSLSGLAYERIKARGTEDGSIGSGLTGERHVVLSASDDITRRFIALIDEFYERRVKLFITSAVPLALLYCEGSLMFEFQRARSRLIEMASEEYQHLPRRGEEFYAF